MGRAMTETQCENCRRAFTVRQSERNRGRGRYCSKSCKMTDQAIADRLRRAARDGGKTA